MKQKTSLVLALDVDNFARAKYFVRKLYPKIKIFKVGPHLFTACGPEVIKFIRKQGAEVFLDLKYYDIPNTVANAVRQAVRLKVKMLTLHISGGKEMLRAAVKACREESRLIKSRRPLLIGVTVLTSKEAVFTETLQLAKIGIESGLDGVVCSAREVRLLKQSIKKKFFAVTPGIRLEKASPDDQKRTATIQEAREAGSDFLVIGRPILTAKEPLQVVCAALN